MPTVYRKPIPELSVEQMRDKLLAMERSFRARWLGLIVLGACATMFGPLVIGSIAWGGQFSAHHVGPIRPWMVMVGVTSAIMLPILFGIEWLTRGKLLESAADAYGEMGSWRYVTGANRGMAGLVFFEICLWGPRMVIAGSKKIAGQSKHADADRNVAATIVRAFALRDEGINTGELFTLSGGNDAIFGDALAYLLFLDLIGISKAGDRAWLLSQARRALDLPSA